MNSNSLFAVTIAAVALGAGCGPDVPFDREGIPRSNPTPIAISDVLEEPDTYAGKRVELGGKVRDVWSQRLFSIIGQQYLDNDTLLVLTKAGDEASGVEKAGVGDLGVRVRVIGTLHTSDVDTLARELDIDLSRVPQHLRHSVFVADSVSIAPPL